MKKKFWQLLFFIQYIVINMLWGMTSMEPHLYQKISSLVKRKVMYYIIPSFIWFWFLLTKYFCCMFNGRRWMRISRRSFVFWSKANLTKILWKCGFKSFWALIILKYLWGNCNSPKFPGKPTTQHVYGLHLGSNSNFWSIFGCLMKIFQF